MGKKQERKRRNIPKRKRLSIEEEVLDNNLRKKETLEDGGL